MQTKVSIENRLCGPIGKMLNIIEAMVMSNPRQSINIEGPPGSGKSQGILQIAKKLPRTQDEIDRGAIYFVDCRLPLFDPPELKGVLIANRETHRTEWLEPAFMPVEGDNRFCKYGILLLDEFTCAPGSLQNCALQIQLDHKLGEHNLSYYWTVITAGNGLEDGAFVTRQSKPAGNRCFQVKIKPTWEDTKKYWTENLNIRPEIVSYLEYRPDSLMTLDPNNDDLAFATCRSWVMLSDQLNAHIEYEASKNNGTVNPNEFYKAAKQYSIGFIGAVASEFNAYINDYVKVSPKSIIKEGIIPDELLKGTPEPSFVYACIGAVSHYMTETLKTSQVTPEVAKNFVKFCVALKRPNMQVFMMVCLKCHKHKTLMMKIRQQAKDDYSDLAKMIAEMLTL